MVSIIASMYRTEPHLKRFLTDARKLSAELTNTNAPHEIILISNDMTDAERALLEPLTAPFRVLSVPREPIYASWNRGVREAQGEVVTFWGVDDTRFAKAIVDGLATLTADVDVTYFPFRYHRFVRIFGLSVIAKMKTSTPPSFDRVCFQKEMHLGPHFMVKRRTFDRVGHFDETYKIAGDFAWQVRAAHAGANFAPTYTVSGIFRNDGTTLSGSRATLHQQENARAIA